MQQKRAYLYRCYPTPDQAKILARMFGYTRYVYNWGLRLRTDAYYQRQERIYYSDTSAAFTQVRRQSETAWRSRGPSGSRSCSGRMDRHRFRRLLPGQGVARTGEEGSRLPPAQTV